MDGLRIGTVCYLNAAPLTRGLAGVVAEVPSVLTDRFDAGELDVALVPSFEALRPPRRPIVPVGVVASRGPVDSVLLFSKGPLREARTVMLVTCSRTSAALTRILFARRWGGRPEFRSGSPETDPTEAAEDAVLLIGDPALTAPREGLLVTDLATEWREWTGLPFCFAVWLARDEETAARAAPVLAEAKLRGLAEREAIAREWAPRVRMSVPDTLEYLKERVTYELGAKEREALALFGGMADGLGLFDRPG